MKYRQGTRSDVMTENAQMCGSAIAGAHASACAGFECQDYHHAGQRPCWTSNRTQGTFGIEESVYVKGDLNTDTVPGHTLA